MNIATNWTAHACTHDPESTNKLKDGVEPKCRDSKRQKSHTRHYHNHRSLAPPSCAELTWLACAGIGMPRASSSYKGAPRVLVVRSPMGSWWRSRDMKYVSLILSEDAAHECVHNLGELSALQFTDLNPEQTAFQRRYVNYVKR